MRFADGSRVSRAHLFEVEGGKRKEGGVTRVIPLYIGSDRFTAEGRAEAAFLAGSCDTAKVYAARGDAKKLVRQFPEEANL